MEKKYRRGEITEETLNVHWNEYVEAKSQASIMISKAIETYEHNMIERAREKGNGENQEWYSFIRGDQGNSFEYPESIRVNGVLIEEEEKIREEIERYMEEIGGASKGRTKYSFDKETLEITGQVDMDTEKPGRSEIRATLKELKENKGVGMDGIPYEFYKHGDPGLLKPYTNFLDQYGRMR